MLLRELEIFKWDIIGLSEVRRDEEEFIEMKNGHIVCYRGQKDKKKNTQIGFLVSQALAENIENFYCLSEPIAGLIIKSNYRYKM